MFGAKISSIVIPLTIIAVIGLCAFVVHKVWQSNPGFESCYALEKPATESVSMLDCELKGRIRYARSLSQQDFLYAQLVLWLSILASLAATILSALGKHLSGGTKLTVLTATLAAVPAATITISDKLNFEARSQWDTKFLYNFNSLLRELHLRQSDPENIACRLSELDKSMEAQFPYSIPITQRLSQDDSDKGKTTNNCPPTPSQ